MRQLLWTLLFLFLSSQVLAAEPATHLEQSFFISEIEFIHDSNLSEADLLKELPFERDTFTTINEVERAVQSLAAREIFDRIEYALFEKDYGLLLQFNLKTRPLLREIQFRGNQAIDNIELQRASRLQVFSPFKESDLVLAKERLQELYVSNGFFHVDIKTDHYRHTDNRYVKALFEIIEGYQSKVESIEVEGTLPEELSPLRTTLEEFSIGRPASKAFLKDLTRSLLYRLRAEGYLEARVELLPPLYIESSRNLALIFEIDVGTPLSIVFSGNEVFDAEELLEPLGLDKRTVPFGSYAIPSLVRAIKRLYREQGYFYVQVQSVELEPEGTRRRFLIDIEEGPRVYLNSISFEHDSEIPASELKQVFGVTTRAIWPFSYFQDGIFDETDIEEGREALETFFKSKGYPQANAYYELIGSDAKSRELRVTIDTGSPTIISQTSVDWRGIGASLQSDELSELLRITPIISEGARLEEAQIEQARIELEQELTFRGYPQVTVDAVTDTESGEVSFEVNPGRQIAVGQINLASNFFTEDEVILRNLFLERGEPLSTEKLRAAERRLIQTGLFREVAILPTDGAFDEDVEDLTVRIAERDTGQLLAGTSINTEDGLRLTLELTQRNLRGSGNSLALRLDGYFKSGEEAFDAGQGTITYATPFVLGLPLTLVSEGFVRNSLELVNEFSFDQYGASFFLTTPFPELFRWRLGIRPFHERVFDVPEDMNLGPDDAGSTFYNVVTGELIFDSRDDRFNPRKGIRASVALGTSTEELASEVDYLRFAADFSFYVPLGSRLVFANRVRGTILEPFGETSVIPLNRRIFLGGRNSLRGFKLNEVGPRAQGGNYVGGDASVVVNSELRYDLIQGLIGILFLDAGQTVLRNEGSFQGDTLELYDPRFSPGIGLKYRTPLGPLGLDVGFPLERELGESSLQLYLSLGTTF